MTAPFIRYEAYGIDVLDNVITDIQGAGIGVNGGYNVVVARNRLWNVGSRSHWLEVGYGSRSCDGRPGDEGRERCAQNLDAGGWGTTRVDDGTNYVRIPNRHVWLLGNVIDNPRRPGRSALQHRGARSTAPSRTAPASAACAPTTTSRSPAT